MNPEDWFTLTTSHETNGNWGTPYRPEGIKPSTLFPPIFMFTDGDTAVGSWTPRAAAILDVPLSRPQVVYGVMAWFDDDGYSQMVLPGPVICTGVPVTVVVER